MVFSSGGKESLQVKIGVYFHIAEGGRAMDKKIALIPAYEPEETMLFLLGELIGAGYECVVIDDGSGAEYGEIFVQASQVAQVLVHEKNRGKGAALKTGMRYIREHYAPDDLVVTVDADGQHKVSDVEKVAQAGDCHGALVLGSRSFTGKVPLRSRFGNSLTRLVYLLATGRRVWDTQTGLRAFPVSLVPTLLSIDGERYEYEMNVLMYWAKNRLPIQEVEIETVYMDGNTSSHFDALKDSFRIYWEILKFSASSFLCFVVDYMLYALFLAALSALGVSGGIVLANVLARIGSGTLNFNVNRKVVFESRADWRKAALKYGILAAEILLANTLLLALLTGVLGITPLVAKVIVEAGLFVFSFAVQKREVFPGGEGLTLVKEEVIADGREEKMLDKFLNKFANKFTKRWTFLYTAALLAFSVYAILDTFVISSVYTVVDQGKISAPQGTVIVQAKEADEGQGDSASERGISGRGASVKESSGKEPSGKVFSEKGSSENGSSGSDSSGSDSSGSDPSGSGSSGSDSSASGSSASDPSGNGSSRKKFSGKKPGQGSGKRKNTQSAENGSDDQTADSKEATKEQKKDTDGDLAAEKPSTVKKSAEQKSAESTGMQSDITLTEYREYDTDIYVAQIDTSSVAALRAAFAQGAYGRNVTAKTSETAESVGALLAINGDYYGAREKGYVIRNGVLYREEGKSGQEDLVIYQDGSFAIIKEDEVTAQELLEQGAWQVFSFGPALLEDGKISVSTTDEVDKAMRDNPRTAIGILENGDYVMVVSDGRTDESEGLSLYELAGFMQNLGVVTAYNLDGGGSSTMVYNGELVNSPTTTGRIKERAVSDIIYIAY